MTNLYGPQDSKINEMLDIIEKQRLLITEMSEELDEARRAAAKILGDKAFGDSHYVPAISELFGMMERRK
ncbi:MAG: hypothetical protein PHV00_06045 [Syntrophales bacterium]|nr:hypothetical protein [Syntrophales bacterium]